MIIKTFNLTAGKTNKVELTDEHSFFIVGYAWVINNTSEDIYISLNADMAAESDGTAKVSSGSIGMLDIDGAHKNLYAIGNGKIEVRVTSEAICPFKSTSKGGEATSDAKTVNGHTVESDVPADAKFTDTTNSDITVSGNPVVMDGLQGGVPFSEMVVSGKNLLKYPYVNTTKTINGITFTDNGDGTITANGTATANATFLIDRNLGFENEGNYFLSGCPSGGGLNSFYINWYQNHTGVTLKNYNDYGSGIIIPYQHIFSENNSLSIAIIAGATVENLVFRPQLELGSTPTEYEPPITGRELTVNVCGKNLIPTDYIANSGTYRGVTVTVKDDGRVDLSGTATSEGYILDILSNFHLIGGKKYTFSCSKQYDVNTFNLGFVIRDKNGVWKYGQKSYPTTIIADEGDYISAWRLWTYTGVEYSAENVEIQMEIGDTATEYETPVGSKITITPDSNPYVIPNDIRQQDGHNVISVSDGTLSVTGCKDNAAIKRIWDSVGMDLLFDGITSADAPAIIDMLKYDMILITYVSNLGTGSEFVGQLFVCTADIKEDYTNYVTPLDNSSVYGIHAKINNVYDDRGYNIKIYGCKSVNKE